MADKTPEEHAKFAEDVREMIERFEGETGWHPVYVKPVAGAIRFTRYNMLVRMIMKNIAKHAGLPVDTSRDYVFTDWDSLDRFVEDIADRIATTCTVTAQPAPARAAEA